MWELLPGFGQFTLDPSCPNKQKKSAICVTKGSQLLASHSPKTPVLPSGGFRGGRAGSVPPPLGDGLTPSLTVLVICDYGTV